MTKPHTISQAKSDSKNAKRYSLKLNKVTDADLIDAIDNMIDERGEPLQKQTAVKKLLRKALYGDPKDWTR
jgi:hypothetical protein